MKHLLLSLFMLLAVVPAGAQDTYGYLTFEQTNGAQYSFAIDRLVLTFEDGKVTATDGETTQSYPLAEMSKMFFATSPTAITEAAAAGETLAVTIEQGRLRVSGHQGLPVSVYASDGRRVGREGLTPGVYLVKCGERTVKVAAH